MRSKSKIPAINATEARVVPRPTKGRRTLVTGGAGFLGSHLCDRLIAEGGSVVCLDSFATGRRENIAHLLDNPQFTLVEHDIIDPIDLEVDEIYNLACRASPVAYAADPIHTTRTSVIGALNMLELATTRGIAILQASTSEVYGDPLVSPQSESYWGNVDPNGPRSCYDEGKRCAESLFFDYARRRGARIKVARIFNSYGPRMRPDDGRVVSNFVVEALQGRDITVYGEGSQTRSFCYADDTVDGLFRLMNSPAAVTGPINIGNPREFTMVEFAQFVLRSTGSRSKLIHQSLPVDDPHRRCPDIALARRMLGWAPKVELEEGLARTIAYFASELHLPEPV